MKKLLPIITGIAIFSCASAQQIIRNSNGSYFRKCSAFRVSRPLSEIAKEHPITSTDLMGKAIKEAEDSKMPKRSIANRNTPSNTASVVDGARQNYDGTAKSHGPGVNVDGQQSTQGYIPLDPNGMVGPNDYFQTVNSNYAIYDKTGATVLAATDLASLFGSWSCDDGDPVVMYDKFADRWVIEEFQENGTCHNWTNSIDTMMFAVSTTNDPTGTYYIYAFCPDNTDFADYPKYTIWADGYYQTCNCQNDKVVVYDRTKMLAGNPAAGFIVMPFNNSPYNVGGNGGFFCPMVLDADGSLPPYGKPNYLFYFWDDNWGSGGNDEICIDQITVDWTHTTGNLTVFDTLPTAPFNSMFGGQGVRTDIDQPGSNASLDALDGFFSYRIPYLRFAGYNSAVMANVVNVGTSTVSGSAIAGIRWYELRQDTTTNKWSIYQQSTYAPNDGESRWNPAIAMNNNGDIGLAYTVSDPTSVYPSVRYTGRSFCDTLSKMTMTETTAIAGSAAGNTFNRWGDYSHTSVDPSDGLTFWHTNMYVGSGGSINTRIFDFKAPACPLSVQNQEGQQSVVTAYQSGSQLNVKVTDIPSYETMVVDLFDLQGKHIAGTRMDPTASGTIETSLNVSGLAKGIYLLRVGNNSFQKVIKTEIQ